jgi:Dolichyl-phosphate-mannose-protein mannosyltransferase
MNMVAPQPTTSRRPPPASRTGRLNLILWPLGIALLLVGLYFDWADLLTRIGFPGGELSNRWVRVDLTTLRCVCVVSASALLASRIVLSRYPHIVARFSQRMDAFAQLAAPLPLFIPLSLTTLVLTKTVLQLGLYFIGYTAYGADDFSRSLSADYRLYHRTLDLGWDGWLGLSGSGWLPFPDYLFSLGLALHRDLFLTPKIVNLAISGIAVMAVYFLGRELFGRFAGFLAAALFAFQPWPVWLGVSGMTSDLPSVVLIALFGVFLVRWLRTDEPHPLLAAAVFLAVANGFRYENWFFSIVLSVFVVVIAVSLWRRRRLARQWLVVGACALAMINAVPIMWMAASYYVLGDWLPALHATNAWMVAFMATPGATGAPATPLAVNQSPNLPQMNLAVLALGSFPVELALSIGGVALFLSSDRRKPLRKYLLIPAATFLLFAAVFKGRLPASMVFARYLLPFIVLVLPFAGFLLTRLLRARSPWRHEGIVAAGLILLAVATLDVGRAFNYPAMVPEDAIDAGWTIRHLQDTGTIPHDGRILIERAQDWGDLGIVVLANRPERFVALNEHAYRQLALAGLPGSRPSLAPAAGHDGVRGSVCDGGFHVEACRQSVLQGGFNLVILSSPGRVGSFQDTFHARSWKIGRYHLFDMASLPPPGALVLPSERRE